MSRMCHKDGRMLLIPFVYYSFSCNYIDKVKDMSDLMKVNRKKIQELRSKFCWSQEELASVSGLSIRTIQRVEKNGNCSLETKKALAAVFELDPLTLNNHEELQNATFDVIFKYGWLVALAISFILVGFWVVDILIPTLKGAEFNNQYELHGNFRYLDSASVSFIIGFLWLSINVLVNFLKKKRVTNNI